MLHPGSGLSKLKMTVDRFLLNLLCVQHCFRLIQSASARDEMCNFSTFVFEESNLAVELLDEEFLLRFWKQFDLLPYCLSRQPSLFVPDDDNEIAAAAVVTIAPGILVINIRTHLCDLFQTFLQRDVAEQRSEAQPFIQGKKLGVKRAIESANGAITVSLRIFDGSNLQSRTDALMPVLAPHACEAVRHAFGHNVQKIQVRNSDVAIRVLGDKICVRQNVRSLQPKSRLALIERCWREWVA